MYLYPSPIKALLSGKTIFRAFGLIFLSFLFTSLLWGQQSFQIEWEKELINENGAKYIELLHVEATDSSAIVAGTISTVNGNRMYVAQYDVKGEIEWERILETDIKTRLVGMSIFDNHIYITGNEDKRQTDVNPIHYAKLNLEGELIWHYDLSEEVDFFAFGSQLEVTDRGIYIRGEEQHSFLGQQSWVAKMNLDGEFQWKQSFDYQGEGFYVRHLHINSQGQIGVLGSFQGSSYHFFMIFNEEGEREGGFPKDSLYSNVYSINSISSDEQGNWLLAGQKELEEFGPFEATTLKLDPNGEVIWSRKEDSGESSKGVYVTALGESKTFLCYEIQDSPEFIRFMYLDSNGVEIWTEDHSQTEISRVNQVHLTKSKEIFVYVTNVAPDGYWLRRLLKFSSEGALQGPFELPQSPTDISANSEYFYAFHPNYPISNQSIVYSLATDSLSEIFATVATGQPYSDWRTSSLVTQDNFIWTYNTSFPSNSIWIHSINKLDSKGEEIWSINKRARRSWNTSNLFSLDSDNNSILVYDSLLQSENKLITLAKFTPQGKQEFTFVFDSTEQITPAALTTDPDNNIYVCYYDQDYQIFFSKIAADGELLWTTDYQVQGNVDRFSKFSMHVSTDSKLVAIININRLFSDGRNNIIQFDSRGNLEWSRELGDTLGLSFIEGFKLNNRQDITAWGRVARFSPGVFQLNSAGEVLWEDIETNSYQVFNGITHDLEGNTYACFSGEDVRIKKIDSVGNTTKTVEHHIPGHSYCYNAETINFTKQGILILGEYHNEESSSTYIFEMLFDDQLNLIESRVDSNTTGYLSTTAMDGNNSVYAAITQGDRDNHRKTLLREYTLPILNIQEEVYPQKVLNVFPNPVTSQIQVKVPPELHSIQNVTLYDINGRVVKDFNSFSHMPGDQILTFHLPAQLIAGTYILTLHTPEGIYTGKMVKSR